MKKKVDDSYPVIVGVGLLERLPALLKRRYPASRYVVICDSTTRRLFGENIVTALRRAKLPVLLLSVPPGERSKSRARKAALEDAMLSAECDRRALVVALGGGVVGDLAGFVAATYLRGIRYIQVPTTLLAMVDSSVGGKTGIDAPAGKNLIGAFWQPEAVVADVSCLSTLPPRQLRNGLVEAAKLFMTSDARSFRSLETRLEAALSGDLAILTRVVKRAIVLKALVVEADERESGRRMILNFGHTVGHALEKLSGYSVLHGEAVALGIIAETRIARDRGVLPEADFGVIMRFIRRMRIPLSLPTLTPRAIVKATRSDKKSAGGRARYVLLRRVGAVHKKRGAYAHAIPEAEAERAIRRVKERTSV